MIKIKEETQAGFFETFPSRPGTTLKSRLTVSQRIPAAAFRRTTPVKRQHAVTILGAGHGGLALAGYLAQQGHRVKLWNRSSARIAPVAASGGIRLTLPASAQAFVRVAKATSDISSAIVGAQLVLVAVPACGHADVARACAPYLQDGQTVLLVPGRTGGALEFRRELHAAGCTAQILLGEANTFPLAARCVGEAQAVIFGTKDELQIAALPSLRTRELVATWKPLLPMVVPARSVLHTGFANVGAILHPSITLFNAERIGRGDSFDFYNEGVTEQVASVLSAADRERVEVAHAYGVNVCSLPEWIANAYGHRGATMKTAVGGNPAYAGIKAPTTLRHRYLLEDVPTGLVPLLELGRAAGLALPTLRNLVNLARLTLGCEGWERPRTLEVLGLAGLDTAGIRAQVARGFAPAAPRKSIACSPERFSFAWATSAPAAL